MKKLIVASVVSFLLYAFLKLFISFSQLNTVVEPENFLMVGISLAFCWSALLYVSGNLNFAIGVNASWLAIALSSLIINFSLAGQSYIFWFYLFFFIFPLAFLAKYLFFSRELTEKLYTQIACLAILLLFSSLTVYLNFI